MHYEFVVPLNTKNLHISFDSTYISDDGLFTEPAVICKAATAALGIFKVSECHSTTMDSNKMVTTKKTISTSDWSTAIAENAFLLTCTKTQGIESQAIVASKGIEAEKLKRSLGSELAEVKILNIEVDTFVVYSKILLKKLYLHAAMENLVHLSQNHKISPSFDT